MSLPAGIESEKGHAGSGAAWDTNGTLVDDSEYNVELLYPHSVGTYNRMRRDAKVRESLLAVTLPVLRARWALDPNEARPEVVRHCAEDLGLPVLGEDGQQPTGRTRDRFSFTEHRRLSALSFVFGHMPFEQVYRIVEGQARLRKLAPRMPQTIAEIKVARDGGLVGIRQHPPGGEITEQPLIKVDRLVWYAHEREGAAWQGQSLLRAAYEPWRRKDEALKVWRTALRRNGIGQPLYKAAQGEDQTSINKGRELARRARVSEVSGASLPFGADLEFKGVTGTLPDHREFVVYQDEQIAGSVLAEVLKLGSSETGSRALGETFIDLLLYSQQAIADELQSVDTAHIVEDIVDINWGPDEQAPRIVVEDIGSDHRVTAEGLAALLKSGALKYDPALEDYVRRRLYRLPARVETVPALPAPTPPKPTAQLPLPPAPPPAAAGGRVPLEHEADTDFDRIQQQWEDGLTVLLGDYTEHRASQIDDLVGKVTELLDADDIAGLGALLPATGGGGLVLAQAMVELAEQAAQEAAAEAARQGASASTVEVDVEQVRDRADVVHALLARDLADVAARQALLRWTSGADVTTVADEIREHLDGLSLNPVRDQLGGALTAAQNQARFAVMDTGPVQRVYASELLDGATCDACSSIDGTEFTSVAQASLEYPTGGHKDCRGGPRCRGTLVAVYEAESAPTVE
jgi:hypothetical protein